MTYKTHILFALVPLYALESTYNYIGLGHELILYSVVAFGALLPDLDEEGSYIGKRIIIFPLIYGMLGVKHRGITHQLIFVVMLLSAVQIYEVLNVMEFESKLVMYGLIFGYLMHLMGDMLTKGGIRNFFYPFSSVKGVLLPRFLRFYTSGKVELVVFSILCLIGLVILKMRVI